jgi:Protein of unknown function (DUF3987)
VQRPRENTKKPERAAEAANSWNDPDLSILDDRRGELPAFPLDVFSPRSREWAIKAAAGAGTKVDHVLVPLLAIASSLIGAARQIRPSRPWLEPFSTWTGVVGFSGTGKTPGLDVTKRALSKIERDRKHKTAELRRKHNSNAERARAAHKKWRAQVKEAVSRGEAAPPMPSDAAIPDEFVAPRLFTSNATVERIAVLLQVRPRGTLMICNELARDEIESALVTQMACTHAAAMAVLGRLGGAHGGDRNMAMMASAASRLVRAYAAQVEVLRRLKNGGSQFVRVEHVHVNEGGQAIVGNVQTSGSGPKDSNTL